MARIDLVDLAHSYSGNGAPPESFALKPVTMTWRQGGAYALLGPSGCGKTTLLRIIAGLEPCEHGEIQTEGQRVTKPGIDRGFVFQADSLLPWWQFLWLWMAVLLATAVSGSPFLGLLGTVWGVMETFSGIAKVQAASLTAMAPGVAGALIATVVGLFVAIPAMFAYNYMVTTIRAITQELDNFTSA